MASNGVVCHMDFRVAPMQGELTSQLRDSEFSLTSRNDEFVRRYMSDTVIGMSAEN